MTPFKLVPLALIASLACALAAVPAGRVAGPKQDDGSTLTGILKSVDSKKGTFTLVNVGVDVDEALLQKLKERGRERAAAPADKDGGAAEARPVVVRLDSKAKIYIKFRSSPSVANNVEQSLPALEPMIGWPVTVTVGAKTDPVVAKEVIAWRGTPTQVR